MKKILVLSMYCNQPLFLEEIKMVKQTWAKDIIEGKYTGIVFYAYTASSDGKYHISETEHTIQVPADDSLQGTAEKTIKCLKFIQSLGIQYDYIFRTNTSTFVNVPLLIAFANTVYDTTDIWGADIKSQERQTGPIERMPIAKGNALLLSKKIIDIITSKENINTMFKLDNFTKETNDLLVKQKINNPKEFPIFGLYSFTVDDGFMCSVYNSQRMSKAKSVLDGYRSFGKDSAHKWENYERWENTSPKSKIIKSLRAYVDEKGRLEEECKQASQIHEELHDGEIDMLGLMETINDANGYVIEWYDISEKTCIPYYVTCRRDTFNQTIKRLNPIIN